MTDDDRTRIKDRIIESMLPHVVFDGWTDKALLAAIADALPDSDISPVIVKNYFTGGMVDVVDHYADWMDRRVEKDMATPRFKALGMTEKIESCIKHRFQLASAHRDAVRKLMAWLALPQNSLVAANMAWRTCSRVWYLSGDKSADFSHYSKRSLLVSVYGLTMLYWLGDEADEQGDFPDTWSFLHRRLKNVVDMIMARRKFTGFVSDKTGPLFSKQAFQRR